jgi:poly(3-hydroxybutyrate) depolymerase
MGAAARKAVTCALLCLLVAGGWALAGCGASHDRASLRPSMLPFPEARTVQGDFVTRRLTVPAGFGSAGRPFYLHSRQTGRTPQPLVLLLHGLYQRPATVEEATGAASFSDSRGFTLVYPVGMHEAWNAGGCCGHDQANDVGYLVDLVHYVATLTPVDLHRVYIWGFSNGGMMAWRAVCQTSDVFAGAGVVAGALLVPCHQAVHVVDLHGARDHTVPYLGGFSWYTHTVFPDSATERSRLARGSTLQVILLPKLGHQWPPLSAGSVDALDVLWRGLRGYRVTHPAAISAPVGGTEG